MGSGTQRSFKSLKSQLLSALAGASLGSKMCRSLVSFCLFDFAELPVLRAEPLVLIQTFLFDLLYFSAFFAPAFFAVDLPAGGVSPSLCHEPFRLP